MQAGMPSNITNYHKTIRINQLKEEIKLLEEELNNAKRDLRMLQKEEENVKAGKN